MRMSRPLVKIFIAATVALVMSGFSAPICAQNCTVPGTHATIQDAIADPACETITLGAQTFAESIEIHRSLTLNGPGTGGAEVQGLILVAGQGVVVELADLGVSNGCTPEAFRATGGALVSATNVRVERSDTLPCPELISSIFGDGFENGDTGPWSDTVP